MKAPPACETLGLIATRLPAASALGQLQAQALVTLVNEGLDKAAAEGERMARFSRRTLDVLLSAWPTPDQAYGPIAKVLEKLGYTTKVDGFTGVSVRTETSAASPQKLTSAAFARELKDKLPTPPPELRRRRQESAGPWLQGVVGRLPGRELQLECAGARAAEPG